MIKRYRSLAFLSLSLLVLLILSSCSPTKEGRIPRGTPDHGNGTPSVIPSPTPLPRTSLTAPANTAGSFYAFVRKDQLWMALNGTTPVQTTSFDYSQLPDVSWHVPVWSPDDHFIAFVVSAHPAAMGGGGCPGPQVGLDGALYLLDTQTKQLTALSLPSVVKNASGTSAPRDDHWQYAFWEDATHLLAWYNGTTGKQGSDAGLYRYDMTRQTITPVIGLAALGASTLANIQPGNSLLLSMRYSQGQLFYQLVVHPFEQQSQMEIYRRSVKEPAQPSVRLLQMGAFPWCTTAQGGSYVTPGWDISPDGEQLVAQMVTVSDADQGVSSIQAQNLNDNTKTTLFAQAPADLLAHDLALTWGPDSQTVVVTQHHLLTRSGPYSASLANPTAVQQYDAGFAGQVVWRADNAAFALANLPGMDTTNNSDVYVFLKGDSHGRKLLTDAHEFAWG